MYRYSRQPVEIKVRFNFKTLQQKYITIVLQNVHTTTTKIIKTIYFLMNDNTTILPCFNFNSKSPLFAKNS